MFRSSQAGVYQQKTLTDNTLNAGWNLNNMRVWDRRDAISIISVVTVYCL